MLSTNQPETINTLFMQMSSCQALSTVAQGVSTVALKTLLLPNFETWRQHPTALCASHAAILGKRASRQRPCRSTRAQSQSRHPRRSCVFIYKRRREETGEVSEIAHQTSRTTRDSDLDGVIYEQKSEETASQHTQIATCIPMFLSSTSCYVLFNI